MKTAFPGDSFTAAFSERGVSGGRPVSLAFGFPVPCVAYVRSIGKDRCLRGVGRTLGSGRFRDCASPREPCVVGFTRLGSLSGVRGYFPCGGRFNGTLGGVTRRRFGVGGVGDLYVDRIVFGKFAVSVSMPSSKLFVTPPSSLRRLICVQALACNIATCFMVTDGGSCRGILRTFGGSFVSRCCGPGNALRRSRVVLLAVSSVGRRTSVGLAFGSLGEFGGGPFVGKWCV